MLNSLAKSLYIMVLFAWSGCIGGVGMAINENIVGNYYLVAADADFQRSLSYHEPKDGSNYSTFIGPTIFAIWHNDKYIIVKQHPVTASYQSSTKKTNYFILPLKEGFNWKTNNGMIGPLSLKEFKVAQIAAHIPDSITYKTFD
jgi:hypothetical protein